ncbi:hypothetical protein F5146DRAFT_613818 [Armillaria mellea]|nr:hypothetical protein F5146DRAFT_613818 [Armillaria mellea]
MLLCMVLSCLSFPISRGLSFDPFSGNVTVGIPITLSWHRETNDSNQIEFVLGSLPGEVSLDGLHLLNATNTTQLNGTLKVTFPGSGEYTVEAITNQTGVVAKVAAQRFEVAPLSQNGGTNSTVPSLSTHRSHKTSHHYRRGNRNCDISAASHRRRGVSLHTPSGNAEIQSIAVSRPTRRYSLSMICILCQLETRTMKPSPPCWRRRFQIPNI